MRLVATVRIREEALGGVHGAGETGKIDGQFTLAAILKSKGNHADAAPAKGGKGGRARARPKREWRIGIGRLCRADKRSVDGKARVDLHDPDGVAEGKSAVVAGIELKLCIQ